MKRNRLLVLSVLGAGLLGLVGYRVVAARRAAAPPAQAAEEAVSITAARVVRADLPEVLALTGTVRPRNEVNVVSKVGGRIAALRAAVGDRVAAGQVLAVIEHEEIGWQSRQADAAAQVARAGVDGAQLELDRTQQLFQGGSVPPAQLDAARVKLQAARAQLAQAEAAAGLARQLLQNAQVTTPIAGVVARRPVDVGAQIGTDTVLFTVQDAGALKLETSVDAAAFARLSRGQAVEITADALPGARYLGRVSLLSPALDPQTRRASVEVEVPRGDGKLLPHTFAHAAITLGVLRGALVVPQAALLEAPGGLTAFRVREGHVRAIRPRLGPAAGGRVVVLEGLAEGDEVATSGLASLADGAAVRPEPEATAAR